ncbi:MAG: hypothetical protein KF816_00235 [Melioribacteraceae bacterium]|nr:hypothetical protein [Melioribacteraceae bacterium]
MLEKLKPWLGSVFLFPVIIYFISNEGKFLFIDYINLLIHEGGHGVFSLFGKFIHALGGTLMQIIIPGMFIVYYFIHKKIFMAQIFLIWLAQNLINISVYAADARAKKLPLLGGNKVYHDWAYLLGELNLLEYDKVVGGVFFYSAIIVFFIVLLLPLYFNDEKRIDLDLKI